MKRETLPPQTDRATRCVRQNLANCCIRVGTACTTNPEQIEVTELERYSRPTYAQTCAFSHDALDRRRCNPQADRRRVFWSHQYSEDLQWRNFLSAKFRNKSHDPDHALLGERLDNKRLILYMVSSCTKFDVSCISRFRDISRGVKF